MFEGTPNNCTLVAVKAVLAGIKTDDEIADAFRAQGWVPGSGMPNADWIRAANSLGLITQAINMTYGITVHGVLRHLEHGTFFVSNINHAMAVFDGNLWDPNCFHEPNRKPVTFIHQVMNPPMRPEPEIMESIKPKSPNSKSWGRWNSAMLHIQANGPTHYEDLIAATEYTAADYRWDKKRGNILYVS